MKKHQGLGKIQKKQRIQTEQKILNYLEIMQPAFTRQIIKHTGLDSHAIINGLKRLVNKKSVVLLTASSKLSNSPKFYCKTKCFEKIIPQLKSKKTIRIADLENHPFVSKFQELESNEFAYSVKMFETHYSPEDDITLHTKILTKKLELNMTTAQLAKIFYYAKTTSMEKLRKKTSIKKNLLDDAINYCNEFLKLHSDLQNYFEDFMKSKNAFENHKTFLNNLRNLVKEINSIYK